MYNCEVDSPALRCMGFALSILSLLMCTAAITAIVYYKFYRSFNYRLILYLLISFLIEAIFTSTAYTKNLFIHADKCFEDLITPDMDKCMYWYTIWNIQLCLAFMTGQIFTMVIFSVELQMGEVALTLACFLLPVVGSAIAVHSDLEEYVEVLGLIVTGCCVVAIVVILFCLACRGLQRHAIGNNNEEQHLLHERSKRRYQNALKESLPFIIYPLIILIWLLTYYLTILDGSDDKTNGSNDKTNRFNDKNTEPFYMYIFFVLEANIGTVSSIVFFMHIKILGQRRRHTFRNRHCVAEPNSNLQQINEGQKMTAAGSVTATHVTHFDPLGDSDVEPYQV